jgi:hypothetical protein
MWFFKIGLVFTSLAAHSYSNSQQTPKVGSVLMPHIASYDTH